MERKRKTCVLISQLLLWIHRFLPLPQAIQRMRTEMEVESPGKQLNVEYMSLDLASLQATKEFAAAFKERHLPLHILVNNAGIAFVPFGKVTFVAAVRKTCAHGLL